MLYPIFKERTVSGLSMALGEAAHQLTITPEMFSRREDDADTVAATNKYEHHSKGLAGKTQAATSFATARWISWFREMPKSDAFSADDAAMNCGILQSKI
jgi:hypothetical protein